MHGCSGAQSGNGTAYRNGAMDVASTPVMAPAVGGVIDETVDSGTVADPWTAGRRREIQDIGAPAGIIQGTLPVAVLAAIEAVIMLPGRIVAVIQIDHID